MPAPRLHLFAERLASFSLDEVGSALLARLIVRAQQVHETLVHPLFAVDNTAGSSRLVFGDGGQRRFLRLVLVLEDVGVIRKKVFVDEGVRLVLQFFPLLTARLDPYPAHCRLLVAGELLVAVNDRRVRNQGAYDRIMLLSPAHHLHRVILQRRVTALDLRGHSLGKI